jgi:PAS domain S-box-containing protein
VEWGCKGRRIKRVNSPHNDAHRALLADPSAAEWQLDALFRNDAVGIFILSLENRYLRVNPRWCSMLGYAEEELLGTDLATVTHPEDLEATALTGDRMFEGDTNSYRMEKRYLRKDGSWFAAEVTMGALRDGSGQLQGAIAVVADVTDRHETLCRRAEEQERLSAHLRQVQQAETLGVLAGGVAHDLNNIMMGVIGSAQLSLAHLPTGSDSRRLIEQVESAAWRAASLARQMLTFAGHGRIASENVDLSALVRGMEGLLSSSVSKRTRLDYRLAEPLPYTVADPVQLEQVVMNLVLNAAESLCNGGSITVSTGAHRVGTRAQADRFVPARPMPGEYVMLKVEDTGAGMDEDTLGRIFDPFYTTKCTGRGLGLAAVMGIVRSYGGAIAVRSSPGEGACFTVLLPAGVKAATAEPLSQGHATPAPPARRPAVVLVADDDDVVRRNARTALEMAGHTTLMAEDGLGAIDAFRQHQRDVDVLLLDMMMPGLGGDEVCATARRLRPGVPVILCSGYDEGVMETSAALDSADGVTFLHKPYSLAELTECVDRCLAR